MTFQIDDRISIAPKTRVTAAQYWALKAGQSVTLEDGSEVTNADGPFRMIADPPAPTERVVSESDTTVMEKVLETLTALIDRAERPQEIVVNIPEQEAPVVTVEAPVVNVELPAVNLNVPQGPAPTVVVNPEVKMPDYVETDVVSRDDEGFISQITRIFRSGPPEQESQENTLRNRIRKQFGLPTDE